MLATRCTHRTVGRAARIARPVRATALALLLLALTCGVARATSHTFRIETIYSNADGSVQYVVLKESAGLDGQRSLAGNTLTSTHAGITKTVTFPVDLPSAATANRRVLVATPGFAALALVPPDYTMPAQFLATDAGAVAYAAVDQVTYGALPTDGRNALDRNGVLVANLAQNFAGAAAALPALPVQVVEYYNASLDHYFISDLQPDIDALDTGRIAGWARTGLGFGVHPGTLSGDPGVNPVCRFYIPPVHGNSHFFSASTAECTAVSAKIGVDPNFSGYVQETPNAFYIRLPDPVTGACAAGLQPVYRLWNQRADSNHRYTADVAAKALMLTKSYVAEGYGPDAVIMCAPRPGLGRVQFALGSAAPNGALVRDAGATATVGWQGYATATDVVTVGPRSGAGEVLAFSARRPVALQPVTWATGAGDQTVTVPFAAEIETPITIWVLAAPYATTQVTALTLAQTAQQIYTDERLGVRFSAIEVVDATGNPQASTFASFTCGAGNATVSAIQSAIGVRAGRINVYLVPLVDGSTSRGNSCSIGGRFAAIAAGAGADLLAHELGHAFALEHVDDLVADFDAANVMHSASSVRAYFTEGQLFRAHLRTASAINAVYGARPALPLRDCDRDTPSIDCPPIRKRVWPDGPRPAN
jgi:hypothetical protein